MTGVIMASKVIMRNERGDLKEGFIGWSWTTFFFGCLPALFRGDLKGLAAIFFSSVIASLIVTAISVSQSDEVYGTILLSGSLRIFWSAYYNSWHMGRLKERGFVLVNGGE